MIAGCLLLAGCAAPLSPAADGVRQLDPSAVASCRFIRRVEVEGGLVYSSASEARRDMLNKLRNEVARAGGDAFAARDIVVERGLSLPFAHADAYRCA